MKQAKHISKQVKQRTKVAKPPSCTQFYFELYWGRGQGTSSNLRAHHQPKLSSTHGLVLTGCLCFLGIGGHWGQGFPPANAYRYWGTWKHTRRRRGRERNNSLWYLMMHSVHSIGRRIVFRGATAQTNKVAAITTLINSIELSCNCPIKIKTDPPLPNQTTMAERH